MFGALLLACVATVQGAEQVPPPPPYYSLQLATMANEDGARKAVADASGFPFARAERHGELYAVRIGAWLSRAEAQEAFQRLRDGGMNPSVIEVADPKPWLFAAAPAAPDGSSTPAANPAPVANPAPAAASGTSVLPPAAPEPATWWRSTVVTLAAVGYLDGYFLEGTEGSREIFLPLPPGLDPQRAEIVLEVKFGEALIGESSFQFSINDTPRRTVRRGEAGTGQLAQVNLPLTDIDLRAPFVKLRVNYTQLLDRDICFSRELAGAYSRISPGSGLMVLHGDAPPASVRAAWSLLPQETVVSADFSQITPSDFQALFQLATLLEDDQRTLRFEHLPADAGLDAVHGQIVLGSAAQLEAWGVSAGVERLAGGNLRLVSAQTAAARAQDRKQRVFLFIDRANPVPAMDMLRMPWRRASGARLLDVSSAAEWPPVPANPETVRLRDLDFSDSERRFTYATDWKIGLPFGPMGTGNRPSRVQLMVYAPSILPEADRTPTILSAYFNDRLVFSGALAGGGEAQAIGFDLPHHMLRARNRLQLVAQRNELADRCKHIQAAQPISVSPGSSITLKPLRETPVTFAELVPHQRALTLFVASDAMRAAAHTIPALVSLGHHFWPDVPPPTLSFFEPGTKLEPTGHFFVIGNPAWDQDATVRFDQGRIRVVSNATQQEAIALDFASDADWALLQMARIGEHAGAWLRTPGRYDNLPRRRVLLEDENVAMLDPRGLQMGLRVGASRDYEVQYPEATGWFTASDRMRTLLFVLLWVLGAALVIYLLRQSRRHRAG